MKDFLIFIGVVFLIITVLMVWLIGVLHFVEWFSKTFPDWTQEGFVPTLICMAVTGIIMLLIGRYAL